MSEEYIKDLKHAYCKIQKAMSAPLHSPAEIAECLNTIDLISSPSSFSPKIQIALSVYSEKILTNILGSKSLCTEGKKRILLHAMKKLSSERIQTYDIMRCLSENWGDSDNQFKCEVMHNYLHNGGIIYLQHGLIDHDKESEVYQERLGSIVDIIRNLIELKGNDGIDEFIRPFLIGPTSDICKNSMNFFAEIINRNETIFNIMETTFCLSKDQIGEVWFAIKSSARSLIEEGIFDDHVNMQSNSCVHPLVLDLMVLTENYNKIKEILDKKKYIHQNLSISIRAGKVFSHPVEKSVTSYLFAPERFTQNIEESLGFITYSIVCEPLVSAKDPFDLRSCIRVSNHIIKIEKQRIDKEIIKKSEYENIAFIFSVMKESFLSKDHDAANEVCELVATKGSPEIVNILRPMFPNNASLKARTMHNDFEI